MTEKEIRKRLDDLTKLLDEERERNKKLTEVVADLAKAAAAGAGSLGQPWVPYPVPVPWPQPQPLDPYRPLPPIFVAYAVGFPNSNGIQAQPPTVLWESQP